MNNFRKDIIDGRQQFIYHNIMSKYNQIKNELKIQDWRQVTSQDFKSYYNNK